MRYLLDTHVFLWWLTGDRRLRRSLSETIRDPGNEIHISAVTAWEIVIKVSIGRLQFPIEQLQEQIERNTFSPLPVTIAHVLTLAKLPLLHRDSFDRILVAQAFTERLTLLSQDLQVLGYLKDDPG